MERLKDALGGTGPMDRRRFLKVSGLVGLGAASVGLVKLTSDAVRFNRGSMKVSRTEMSMGSYLSMTLVHPSQDEAEEAMGRAFEEVDRLIAIMSRYDARTPVWELNRTGRLTGVPPELAAVLDGSAHYYRVTGGLFDITVQPVVDFYRDNADRGAEREPTASEAADLLARVGLEKMRRDPNAVEFTRPGMGITLDGIAVGYIVDRACELLARRGIRNYLVNASGDIRLHGLDPRGEPWAVAIQDPRKQGNYPDVVHMDDGAISTSGDYEIYFDRERVHYHIVDPRSGASPEIATSSTIRAATCIEADALATSLMILGTRQGADLIDSLPGCESLVVGRDGRIWKSQGWSDRA